MFDSFDNITFVFGVVVYYDSMTFRLVVFPGTNVCVGFGDELTLAMFDTTDKITLVYVVVIPDKDAFPLWFIIDVVSDVDSEV